jgi:hypothetical protein
LNPDTRDDLSSQPPDSPRPRYEKPAIVWRDGIDVQSLAIGCGKAIPSDPLCASGGPQS